jgi:hypothetical protein
MASFRVLQATKSRKTAWQARGGKPHGKNMAFISSEA